MIQDTEISIFTGITCKQNENKCTPKIMCTYAPNGKDAFKDIQNVWKIMLTSDHMEELQSTRLFMKKPEKVRYIKEQK